jgi:hypothetical protein
MLDYNLILESKWQEKMNKESAVQVSDTTMYHNEQLLSKYI